LNKIPEWLPNWQDETSYSFPDSENLRLWAWEFLRRNPEYQKAWQDNYVDGPQRWVIEDLEKLKSMTLDERQQYENDTQEYRNEMVGRMDNQFCDPPALPGEMREEYFKRTKAGSLRPLGKHLSEKFGLSAHFLWDPADNRPDWSVIRFKSSAGPSFLDQSPGFDNDSIGALKPSGPSEVVVKFNFEWPLEMQWRRVSWWLEHRQKKLDEEGVITFQNPRKNVSRYPVHLRLLDADIHGVPVSEIAAVMFPEKTNEYANAQGSQTVKNKLAAAKKMRDEGYLYLGFD